MKTQQGVTRLLVLSSALALAWAGSLHAAPATETAPGVPNIFNPAESDFQNQTHFLVFTGSDSAGENAKTAKAYYDAIDPSRSKRTFTSWLKNAGFISDESQWHSTGAQKVACDLPGCDLPSHQPEDRKSTRLNSSHGYISYAVFCLKKKKTPTHARPPAHHTLF